MCGLSPLAFSHVNQAYQAFEVENSNQAYQESPVLPD